MKHSNATNELNLSVGTIILPNKYLYYWTWLHKEEEEEENIPTTNFASCFGSGQLSMSTWTVGHRFIIVIIIVKVQWWRLG